MVLFCRRALARRLEIVILWKITSHFQNHPLETYSKNEDRRTAVFFPLTFASQKIDGISLRLNDLEEIGKSSPRSGGI